MAYNATTAAVHDVSLSQLRTVTAALMQKLADAIAALPTEQFLDQTKTKFEPTFTWSAVTYPGSTDPSLNGKPVMVLAIKGVDNANPSTVTTSFSFLDMTTLVDTYTAKAGDSAKILNISGYEIEVKIDTTAGNGNHISVTNNGLMVDVSDKADKVVNATAGNIATLDANGNLVDSGRTFAEDSEITDMLADVFASA
ncbi:MAG: hypothetical protein IJQ08_00865 [Synergistaceae bacterium]|nr:hypothetical protein [Synergistaceae bacterium]